MLVDPRQLIFRFSLGQQDVDVNDYLRMIGMSLFSIPPGPFAILANLIGVALAKNLNLDQQDSLGNFFQSIGQSMATFGAQQALQESQSDNEQMYNQIQLMKEQLKFFEERIKNKL
jgi:hypothetical protein